MDCVAEFGVEVHYIKHEVKQSQIPHDLVMAVRSTFSTVVMRSSVYI